MALIVTAPPNAVNSPLDTNTAVRFRSGTYGLVPYIEIELVNPIIRNIRIGPGPNAEVRVDGARKLLALHNSKAEVHLSNIPLR